MSVSPDQITALATAVIGAAGGISMRWLSKAGRVIRRLRRQGELMVELVYRTRGCAQAKGATVDELPPIPQELLDSEFFGGGGEGD